MSLDKQLELFYSEYGQDSNIFESINDWSRKANTLCEKSYNRLSKSESLSSILERKLPDDIDKRIPVQYSDSRYVNKYIKEATTYIDDVDVKRSVINSMYISTKKSNLLFVYVGGLTNSQKSRVRIICRMIWNDLFLKGE